MAFNETIFHAEKRTPNRSQRRAGPATIDAGTGTVLRTQRTPLKTLEHVKRELGRLYRAVKSGELPSDEGSKRAYILTQLGKIIEAADLERRIETLERALPANSHALLPPPDDVVVKGRNADGPNRMQELRSAAPITSDTSNAIVEAPKVCTHNLKG